jgi:hypothetical protein
MNRRAVLVAVCLGAALVTTAVSGAAPGLPTLPPPTVTVEGAPGNGLIPFNPLTLTVAQLAALPQQQVTVSIGGQATAEEGPLVSALLTQAGFQTVPGCKNDELRYWVEASSLNGAAAEITAGELDKNFGNRQAILSVEENGTPLAVPRLVVPGDATDARDIQDVFNVTVGRAAPQLANTATPSCTAAPFTPPVTAPTPGSVLLNGDVATPGTLTFDQLGDPAVFQQVSQTVSINGTPTTENGPRLFDVVSAAAPQLQPTPNDDLRWYVEVTSSEDGYAADVSLAEMSPARDAVDMLLSRFEAGVTQESVGPRLTVPGDVRAGRYVSGSAVVSVFRAPTISPVPGSGPNLAGANLRGQDLAGGYLVGASLSGANLNGADLSGAFLDAAGLQGANLNNADPTGALLNGASLEGANLHGADLTGANLTGADLTGANLHGATLTGVVWSNTICPDGTNSDDDGGACSP